MKTSVAGMLLLVLSVVFAAAQSDNGAASNSPPKVAIVVPSEVATFAAPANITVVANASDADGYLTIQTVEFFAGTNSLGIRTNYATANAIGPFFLVWSNVSAGNYILTARARDNSGASSISPPVSIRVGLDGTNAPAQPPEPRLIIPPQCFAEVRTNGCRLLLSADTPATCVVECSVDLFEWRPIYTNTLSGAAVELRDCEGSAPLRFYRLRVE